MDGKMSTPRSGHARQASGQTLMPSRGGLDFLAHDARPSGPAITAQDLRDAALVLTHRAISEAGLAHPWDHLCMDDLTEDQRVGLTTALQALGAKESPLPDWYRDPITRDIRRQSRNRG